MDLELVTDPLDVLVNWQEQSRAAGHALPEAMTLATVGADGHPHARTVLLKDRVGRGLTFFTNYGSQKARDLEGHPRACLLFHFARLERQVNVQGGVRKVSREESEAYFATRPRESQLSAWASTQSAPIGSRAELEARYQEVSERFQGGEVPCPPHWGGFRLEAERVELWIGRPGRLHDRVEFLWNGAGWGKRRLCP
jgi:pyridoxamine 5'-phosphate oxidase